MSSGAGSRSTVTFLSDYGISDEFVGVVTSVLRRLSPHAVVVHLTHELTPHDVRGGGLLLGRAAPWLAPGVVLAVVDPGVGTARRAVAVEAAGRAGGPGSAERVPLSGPPPGQAPLVLVGPDNGLLMPALDRLGGASRAVRLEGRDRPDGLGRSGDGAAGPELGPTFDGRDLFAPAAAALCNGADLGDLGPALDPAGLVAAPTVRTVGRPGEVITEVLWVDRFGNAQLAAGPADLAGAGPVVELQLAGGPTRAGAPLAGAPRRSVTRVRAFADLAPGELGLVVDSVGLLALVLDRRSAAAELGLSAGDSVVLSWEAPLSAGRSYTSPHRATGENLHGTPGPGPARPAEPRPGGGPAPSRRPRR